jgi:AAA15 family ATPase/GTPase
MKKVPHISPTGRMIHSANILGYRGFNKFELRELGRLNLLVGRNNSGKSSALEALYLLATAGDPSALWNTLQRRGEQFPFEALPG